MSYSAVGQCTRCGAPIYAEYPWMAVTPPPFRYSCLCWVSVKKGRPFYKTTSGTTVDEQDTKNKEQQKT
jgi:hypothetical protein